MQKIEKNKIKQLFLSLFKKIDKKIVEKSKVQSCCCKSDNKEKKQCCS